MNAEVERSSYIQARAKLKRSQLKSENPTNLNFQWVCYIPCIFNVMKDDTELGCKSIHYKLPPPGRWVCKENYFFNLWG